MAKSQWTERTVTAAGALALIGVISFAIDTFTSAQAIGPEAAYMDRHEPLTPAVVAYTDNTIGLPVSDAAARAMGYRDWNDYVDRRPPNKMGVADPVKRDERIEHVWHPEPDTPSLWSEEAADEQIVDPREIVTERRVYVDPYQFIGSGHRDRLLPITSATPMHSTSVPEPGTAAMLLTGLAALVFTRRPRK